MGVVTRRAAAKEHKASLSKRNGGVKDEKSSEKDESLWARIKEMDEKYTAVCAICANQSSTLSVLRPVMKLIEISCHGIPWLLGSIGLLLSVHQAFHVEILVNLVYGLILDLIVIATLKLIFRRQRPAHNEMDMFATVSVDKFSFPSGHASRAGMLTCFFIIEYIDTIDRVAIIIVWSLIVTTSRVILGRHHLIDVICGYIVGIFEFLLLVYLWIPRDTCMSWLELYFSHFHL